MPYANMRLRRLRERCGRGCVDYDDAGDRNRGPDTQTDLPAAGDAASAAVFSLVLFALGALVPMLPFCVLRATLRVDGSIAFSVAALFLLGLATSLFNARAALFSGLRQVAIGSAAAAITYLVGEAFRALAGASH
jgi:VIT1/CCC1 family predicted Fe2+/Mn2+ transporter